MSVEQLPGLNATLNGLCFLLLVTGFVLVKRGNVKGHRVVMISALVVSTCFLASYLYYHYHAGRTVFPKEYPIARMIYLAILLPHTILAVVNLPFIIWMVEHQIDNHTG